MAESSDPNLKKFIDDSRAYFLSYPEACASICADFAIAGMKSTGEARAIFVTMGKNLSEALDEINYPKNPIMVAQGLHKVVATLNEGFGRAVGLCDQEPKLEETVNSLIKKSDAFTAILFHERFSKDFKV